MGRANTQKQNSRYRPGRNLLHDSSQVRCGSVRKVTTARKMWIRVVNFPGSACKFIRSAIRGVPYFGLNVMRGLFRTIAKPVKGAATLFKRTVDDEQLEYSDVENQYEDTSSVVNDHRQQSQIKTLQHEVQWLRNALQGEKKNFKSQFPRIEKERSIEIEALSKENSDLQRKFEKVETEFLDLEEQHRREVDDLQRRFIDMKGKFESEKKINENLKNRLSKALSDQLHDNNPNIADLSDENRPTKLVEKFSELYDNEWTSAYGVLQEHYQEHQIICILLDLLMDCHQKCREQATSQLESARTKYKNISPAVLKHLKDERKKHAQLTLPVVIQLISISIEHKYSQEIIKNSGMQMYIQHCIELCWLMAVQDPPMAITTEVPKNLMYNKNIFKEYTKTGKYVDYVVWPAILIKDGGALMAKGIVQCCDRAADSKVGK